MAFVPTNKPGMAGAGPNIPNAPGVAGPVGPQVEGDDIEAYLKELGMSQEELDRLTAKQQRLTAAGRPVRREIGQVGDGNVFFDPAGAISNVLERRRYERDVKEADAGVTTARDKQAEARAKVAARIPGLDDAAVARIAASTTDDATLNALQLIRQRNAEERGVAREDAQRKQEREQREADILADREFKTQQTAEERTWQTDERARDRASRRAELEAQLAAQTGEKQREAGAKAAKEAATANQAYSTWQQAAAQLNQSFKKLGSGTGTLEGMFPAMGEETRAVESDRANLAPVLKGLFRTSGEGTFTDKDQELLMGMVPTRRDNPRAAEEKLRRIDAIVQQKLGMAQPQAAPPPGGPTFAGPNTKGGMSDASPQGWTLRIKPKGSQ